MELLSHYPSYMRGHGSPVKFPAIRKGEPQPPFLKRVKRKTQRTIGQSPLSTVPGKIMEQILLETVHRDLR